MLDDVAGIEAAAKELRAAIPELKAAGEAIVTDIGTVGGTLVKDAGVMLNGVIDNLFSKFKAAIHIETKE